MTVQTGNDQGQTAPAGTPSGNDQGQNGGQQTGTTPPANDFQPITSQDDLNRIIAERVRRAKPSDYDELKAKATKLDELDAANKSEVERAQEASRKAEERAKAAEISALRYKIAAKHQISDDDAELYLTASDEETLTRQAAGLQARSTGKTPTGQLRFDHQGQGGAGNDTDAQAREFFGI